MSEFKWHMMAEGMPEKGKKDYLVMGPKGGLYLAPRFEGYGDNVWFRDTRGNHHYPYEVLAWAEVPKLEDMDAQESDNSKLRELIQKTWKWEKNGCYECPLEKDCKVLCVYDGDCGMAVEIEKELQELGIEVD